MIRKRTIRNIFVCCLVVFLLFFLFNNINADEIDVVQIGSRIVFKLYSNPEYDSEVKADLVSRRITNLFNSGLNYNDVRIEEQNGNFYIYWGSENIIQVDKIQAEFHKSTPKSLAQSWANNMKQALKEQRFYLSPQTIRMPVYSRYTIKARGLATGDIVKEYDGGNVSIGINQEMGEVSFFATGVGTTRASFIRGGIRSVVKVIITPKANNVTEAPAINEPEKAQAPHVEEDIPEVDNVQKTFIKDTKLIKQDNPEPKEKIVYHNVKFNKPSRYLEIQVSGDPASDSVLKRAARKAVQENYHQEGDKKITIGDDIKAPHTLAKGDSTIVYVPIFIAEKGKKVKTEDGFKIVAKIITSEIPVKITNNGLLFKPVSLLMVSDRPEVLEKDGILFHSSFSMDEPTRLFYYHHNNTTDYRYLAVELRNPTAQTAHVLLSSGKGCPARWGANVGHSAALSYFDAIKNNINYKVKVPSRSSLNISIVKIPSNLIASGYINMQILEGSKLEVIVKNSAKTVKHSQELPVLAAPFNPFRIHPKGVFSPANKEENAEFIIGKDGEKELTIGKAPWLIDKITGEPNNGNYGVFYTFNIKISNPTQEKKRVAFYLRPDNVMARGTFLIDNHILETGVVRNPSQRIFAVKDLEPRETTDIELHSTPEGGSHYPVSIVLREISYEMKLNLPEDAFLNP
ncbi:MAG: hypothetical protein ACLFQV_03290 [Vulcanimicrobiota bacterium]